MSVAMRQCQIMGTTDYGIVVQAASSFVNVVNCYMEVGCGTVLCSPRACG